MVLALPLARPALATTTILTFLFAWDEFAWSLTIITDRARELDQARELSADLLRQAKRHGLSDAQIGRIRHLPAELVRQLRHSLGIRPVFKTVDTCAAEFAATTPYHYSSYDEENEVIPSDPVSYTHLTLPTIHPV